MKKDKFSYGFKLGIKSGFIFSIITIVFGMLAGTVFIMFRKLSMDTSVNVLRIIVNFLMQNDYETGLLRIRIPSNIIVLLFISLILYKICKKNLKKNENVTLVGYVIATAISISLTIAMFNMICTVVETANAGDALRVGSTILATINTLLRVFIRYTIILCILWLFSRRKSYIDSGYLSIYTYVKYIMLAMFIFAVIVEVDLFRFISVEGKVLGLGDIVGNINFSGNTAVMANFGLVFSVGNIAGYILAIGFGGVVVQSAEFAKQSEIYSLSLREVFNGELGIYSIILFVTVLVTILFVIFLAAWKLKKENFRKDAITFIIGVVTINILIVSISAFNFEFTKILKIGIDIKVIPIVIFTILELLIAVGAKFIYLKMYRKKEKGVAN